MLRSKYAELPARRTRRTAINPPVVVSAKAKCHSRWRRWVAIVSSSDTVDSSPTGIAHLDASLRDSLQPVLDRQHRLATLFRQLHFKGIEEKNRLGVGAHQGSQFRQVFGPELVECRLERLLADLMGLEKLPGVVDHRRFIGAPAARQLTH